MQSHYLTRPLRILIVLLLGAIGVIGQQALAADHTNVLFIVVDDLNVALGTYGEYPTAKTPHIDQLASQGVRFDRAYAQDPVCNPSRTSFLSGMRPATTNVYGNFEQPRTTMGDVVMLPEYFDSQGYFTARVGKIGHGRYEQYISWDVSENAWRHEHYLPGTDHSEVRDNTWTQGSEKGMSRADVLKPTGRSAGLPLSWRATDEQEDETQDGRTTRRIIELLKAHKDEAFFIAAGYHKPHQPWVAPATFFKQHPIAEVVLPDEPADDVEDIPKPALGNYPDDRLHSEAQQRQAIAAYHATITLIDHQVGLLMETLADLGLEESTLVVFVSDHGFHLAEHGGLWRKHTQFEESTRVPLIVRMPGNPDTRNGRSTSGLVELVDLYPTLADLCSLPHLDGLEGTSFKPLLENPKQNWKSAIFSEAKRQGYHGRTVRTTRYRYTEWTPLKGKGAVLYELYDLDNDPKEYDNLVKDRNYKTTRTKLSRKLQHGWQNALPKIQ